MGHFLNGTRYMLSATQMRDYGQIGIYATLKTYLPDYVTGEPRLF